MDKLFFKKSTRVILNLIIILIGIFIVLMTNNLYVIVGSIMILALIIRLMTSIYVFKDVGKNTDGTSKVLIYGFIGDFIKGLVFSALVLLGLWLFNYIWPSASRYVAFGVFGFVLYKSTFPMWP